MPPSCVDCKVKEVRPLGQSGVIFELWLDAPAQAFKAGQFIMVRPRDFGLELAWARPFSIWQWNDQGLGLIIRVAGKGTQRLMNLRPGEDVAIWGPLGRSFVVEPEARTLLLAGGVGLAPLAAYARLHPRPENLRMVFGHREPLDCYPWESGSMQCEQFHERGPGDLAKFIDILCERVGECSLDDLILACGPLPFLRTVKKECAARGLRLQVSLENTMACGVGACLGCVSKNAEGWPVQVCTNGPVFWAEDISLEDK